MLGNIKKYVLTSFVMCGIATVIALGVMFIAYSIPIDWVRSNVKKIYGTNG